MYRNLCICIVDHRQRFACYSQCFRHSTFDILYVVIWLYLKYTTNHFDLTITILFSLFIRHCSPAYIERTFSSDASGHTITPLIHKKTARQLNLIWDHKNYLRALL